MAAAAREMRYRGRQAVNGSLAYDLDYAVRERELRHAGEASRAQEAPKVRAVPRTQVRARQYVSKLTVLSVAAIMALATLVLMNYVQLTLLSADTVKLQTQLSELETENVNLTAQYQQMFDMAYTLRDAPDQALPMVVDDIKFRFSDFLSQKICDSLRILNQLYRRKAL